MKVKIALGQFQVTGGDINANINRMEDLAREAAQKGAKICVFPEYATVGFESEHCNLKNAEKAEKLLERFVRLSAELDVTIFTGTITVENGRVRNSQVCYSPDGQKRIYNKRNFVLQENFHADHDNRPQIWDTPYGKMGCAICKDMFVKKLFTPYRGKADLICISSAWQDSRSLLSYKGILCKMALHANSLIEEICAKIAAHTGAPLVYCNAWGGPYRIAGKDIIFLGSSRMAMPDGKIIAEAGTECEELLIADVEVGRSAPADVPFPWRSIGPITPIIIIEYVLCRVVIAGKFILKIFHR